MMIEGVPLAADAAQLLADKVGTTLEQAKAILRAQAELAWEQVASGKSFIVPGIGALKMVERSERMSTIPAGPDAGKEILVPAKRILQFRIARLAKMVILDRASPSQDLFDPGPLANFKVSVEAEKLSDGAEFLGGLGERLTSRRDGSAALLAVYQLPDLRIESGRIMAADILGGSAPPLARRVPRGAHPLGLIAAGFGMAERIAFAILRFSFAPIVRWEVAVFDGQDAASLQPGEVPAYGVDTGMGSFCDAAFEAAMNTYEGDVRFSDLALMALQKSDGKWLHVDMPAGSIAIFSSGCGDGTYPSYFGFDNSGNIAALVTDFGILNWSQTEN